MNAPIRLSMRPAHQTPVGKFEHPCGQHAGVADPEPRLCLGAAGGADVDPELLHLGDLLAILLFHQVDRLLSHDSRHLALPPEQTDSLPDEHLVVPPADGIEAEEAVLVDVGDHHSDLVDVTGEHDAGSALRIDGREGVARGIGQHLVGETFRFGTPGFRGRRLEGGRAGGVEQGLEERQGLRAHGRWPR